MSTTGLHRCRIALNYALLLEQCPSFFACLIDFYMNAFEPIFPPEHSQQAGLF